MTEFRHLFGTNGIRGVVNKELTPERAINIGSAIGTFFNRGILLVGHDARISSPMLVKAVIAGLNATGCDVIFVGMAPTPTLQYTVKINELDGAVIVTASHNPPEYNGIKVIWRDGVELSRRQEIEVENIFYKGKPKYVNWSEVGKTSGMDGIIYHYVEAIKTHVNVAEIKKKRYHVIVDAANSVGNLTAPRLLREMGCKVTTINGDINGTFPGRPPEPRPENIRNLASTVEATGAECGVAYDGDGDRSIFVDEKGEIYWGDKTFGLITKYFLIDNPHEKIVTPVSSSTLIKDVADTYNGEVTWTKVGSITVSQTMKKVNAKLGGEENGGIFYGPHQPVRDGAMATALIIDILAKTDEKLSKLLEALPKYFIEKGKVACPERLKGKVREKLIERVKELKKNTIDGVKLWFDDGSGILIRPSGTEPIFRLYAEAKNEERAKKILEQYRLKLKKIIREGEKKE